MKELARTTWSAEKLAILKICYHENIPLKTIARLVNKSYTSVSKMLTRSGVRPTRAQLKRLKGLKTHQGKEEGLLRRASALPFKNRHFQVIRHRRPQRVNHRFQETWISLDQLMAEFEQNGQKIKRTEDPRLLRQGFSFLLDNKPMKSLDLLRIINLGREEHKLPRIFIEGITDR